MTESKNVSTFRFEGAVNLSDKNVEVRKAFNCDSGDSSSPDDEYSYTYSINMSIKITLNFVRDIGHQIIEVKNEVINERVHMQSGWFTIVDIKTEDQHVRQLKESVAKEWATKFEGISTNEGFFIEKINLGSIVINLIPKDLTHGNDPLRDIRLQLYRKLSEEEKAIICQSLYDRLGHEKKEIREKTIEEMKCLDCALDISKKLEEPYIKILRESKNTDAIIEAMSELRKLKTKSVNAILPFTLSSNYSIYEAAIKTINSMTYVSGIEDILFNVNLKHTMRILAYRTVNECIDRSTYRSDNTKSDETILYIRKIIQDTLRVLKEPINDRRLNIDKVSISDVIPIIRRFILDRDEKVSSEAIASLKIIDTSKDYKDYIDKRYIDMLEKYKDATDPQFQDSIQAIGTTNRKADYSGTIRIIQNCIDTTVEKYSSCCGIPSNIKSAINKARIVADRLEKLTLSRRV